MRVGGRDFNLTRQEVEACMEDTEPESIQKHAVEVNDRLFPPKQVISQVTGWERTSFTTLEAQRVLARLGFVGVENPAGLVRTAGEFVAGAVRDSARQAMQGHGEAEFQKGFTCAAKFSLRLIQKKLEELRDQMKGPGLSQAEQAVYAHLDELKFEIEAEYDHFWHNHGIDWRPQKPLVKARMRSKSHEGGLSQP